MIQLNEDSLITLFADIEKVWINNPSYRSW